ncbi:putative methyltransferase-domain-containing protein [Mycena galopus ATCC 62051]|nr:putative methyltransferase-domain-containing protein [Mycena galopus ATCC 62051]
MDDDLPLQKGLIRLPLGSERVVDADEEVSALLLLEFCVFILYSNKSTPAPSNQPRGLGYVDSHTDILSLNFELKTPSLSNQYSKAKRKIRDKTVEIQLAQDKTALRSRTGDTGSVVWRASVDFAQMILEQNHANSPASIFDERLKDANVLELGAGTGLLSIALSPLVGQYTATDIAELVPLIRKNVSLNFPGWPNVPTKQGVPGPGQNVAVDEINWEILHSTPLHRRAQLFPPPPAPFDIVLVVDCIYHPNLLPPLLAAMDYVSTAGTTAVLVLMELRAEDVTRDFLEGWLTLGGGEWEIWRIANDEGMLGKNQPYVMWVGWKPEAPAAT